MGTVTAGKTVQLDGHFLAFKRCVYPAHKDNHVRLFRHRQGVGLQGLGHIRPGEARFSFDGGIDRPPLVGSEAGFQFVRLACLQLGAFANPVAIELHEHIAAKAVTAAVHGLQVPAPDHRKRLFDFLVDRRKSPAEIDIGVHSSERGGRWRGLGAPVVRQEIAEEILRVKTRHQSAVAVAMVKILCRHRLQVLIDVSGQRGAGGILNLVRASAVDNSLQGQDGLRRRAVIITHQNFKISGVGAYNRNAGAFP